MVIVGEGGEGATPAHRTLRLRPFRAMRYDPSRVEDLGLVTSPPYDVMDHAMIEAALRAHPHNIVRLILPRLAMSPNQADPYDRAASTLEWWRSRSVLLTDSEPGLYVYAYADEERTVCGLVGTVALRARKDRVILPHEDVTRGIVEERMSMVDEMRANLEPILLVYDGAGQTASVIATARQGAPLVDLTAPDGTTHQLWAITERSVIDQLSHDIAPRQALIADGHHRYATYRRLRQRHRRAGDGAGPWDRGLAMLVDQSQFPLALHAIHRSVSDLRLERLTAPVGCSWGPVVRFDSPAAAERWTQSHATPRHLVVTDGRAGRMLVMRARDTDADHDPEDIELLDDLVLPAWNVEDARVSFHHHVRQAIAQAVVDGGLAVLLVPSTVNHVMSVARRGQVMPRKSTSFGPKPRMGIVMRHFDDEADPPAG